MVKAYLAEKLKIDLDALPEKNRLFVQPCTEDGTDYFILSEGDRVADKGKKPDTAR